jgi:hypothetical protein
LKHIDFVGQAVIGGLTQADTNHPQTRLFRSRSHEERQPAPSGYQAKHMLCFVLGFLYLVQASVLF